MAVVMVVVKPIFDLIIKLKYPLIIEVLKLQDACGGK
jgi:hypothetical protein